MQLQHTLMDTTTKILRDLGLPTNPAHLIGRVFHMNFLLPGVGKGSEVIDQYDSIDALKQLFETDVSAMPVDDRKSFDIVSVYGTIRGLSYSDAGRNALHIDALDTCAGLITTIYIDGVPNVYPQKGEAFWDARGHKHKGGLPGLLTLL